MKLLYLFFLPAFSLLMSEQGKQVYIVRIQGMRFVPSVISIKKGDKVQWINSSGSWHNVVAIDKSFGGDLPGEGDTRYEHEFTQTGAFGYYCRPHKLMGMKGKIIVTD